MIQLHSLSYHRWWHYVLLSVIVSDVIITIMHYLAETQF